MWQAISKSSITNTQSHEFSSLESRNYKIWSILKLYYQLYDSSKQIISYMISD